jgi:hypothetical protein
MIDPFNPLTHLESSPSKTGWIGYFAKPAVMLLLALVFGYATMWLSTNFVRQDKFASYVERQIESDKRQDQVLKDRFDITQTKLETIINQQVSYTEQLKSYNQVMLAIQKQVDSLDDRLKYVERAKDNLK